MRNLLLAWTTLSIICISRRIEAFAPPTANKLVSSSSSKNTIKQRLVNSKDGKLAAVTPSKTDSENQLPHQQQQGQDSTVLSLKVPSINNQEITLIGTAHLSEKSNEQVKRLIAEIKPNVVMIELDPSRLGRIGISDVKEINLEVVSTGEEIQLPSKNKNSNRNWFLTPLKDAILEVVSRTARVLLTGMYKDMSKEMKNDQGGGGEFLVAIRAAEDCTETTRLVLGDRSSVTTIRRAATLAWESGNPLDVLNRLNECNAKEMKQLEEQVQSKNPDIEDRGELQVAVMEALKEDDSFRDRLFHKLEQEVPEFTEAFLKERDYIMSESIRQELDNNPDVERVVGVVGLAHLPGMAEQLKQMLKLE